MVIPEHMLEPVAEMMVHQARVTRAESALLKARRGLSESLTRMVRLVEKLPQGAALPPTVTAALQLRQELPEATGDEPTGSLRQRIVAVMETNPGEIYTPARLAPLIGSKNRDSIRNTLLALAARGKIKKIGDGQYMARPSESTS